MRICVMIPIGPGHAEMAKQAVRSVMAANKAESVNVAVAYEGDPDGKKGRSVTRNSLLRLAGPSDWLFWLDADDLMAPDAFRGFLAALEADPSLDAVWGQIAEWRGPEHPPLIRDPQVYPASYRELIQADPFRSLNMGYFVRASVQAQEPWREDLNAGEDFDMYLRLWKGYRCAKVQTPFMLNRRGFHSQGPKSATPGEWRRAALGMLAEARQAEGL